MHDKKSTVSYAYLYLEYNDWFSLNYLYLKCNIKQ